MNDRDPTCKINWQDLMNAQTKILSYDIECKEICGWGWHIRKLTLSNLEAALTLLTFNESNAFELNHWAHSPFLHIFIYQKNIHLDMCFIMYFPELTHINIHSRNFLINNTNYYTKIYTFYTTKK